jgi:hypothetical protein
MPYSSIPLAPGVVRDESPLAAKPYYIDADKMRAVGGKMETIYGQELVTSSALTGVCRGVYAWADLARTAWAALGTHQRLHVMDQDGTLADITPVIARGELVNPFSVSSGSSTIIVRDDDHNLVPDQLVRFPRAAAAANVVISGAYTVSSVISSSAYAFTASSAATLSTAAVGGTVDIEYGLAPGNVSNLGGPGYGTGGYGIGGYSQPATLQDLDARTWSLANWGQNLIANPNWGGIYEWTPQVASPELVTAGDFASSGAWVLGSGWTLASGAASASSGARLSQAVSLARSAWHLLRFDVTRNSGTIQPFIGTSSVGGPITATGTFKRTFISPFSSAQTLIFDGSSAFSGGSDNVSLTSLVTAHPIPGAPSSAGSVFVTAERNLVACGTVTAGGNHLDPMHVRWSAAENNQDWTPSPSNVAGGYTLSHGSRIVRGLAGNRENLIFTDTAVYRMRSVPDPAVVYAFDLLGDGCGLIGPNAVVQANGLFFWVSKQGKFYMYAGGAPTPLANPSERDFRDHSADVQGGKIYAAHLSSRSEVWWFYPDERDGVECSRYHVYNYAGQAWVSGAYDRTAYADAGVFPFPLATDADGRIYYQEKDFSNDGAARASFLETAYFGIGDGEQFAFIKGVRPDFEDLRGGVAITFTSRNDPQGPERSYGPYSITPNTRRLSVRIKGRQIKYKITADAAPSFFRIGAMTFDLNVSGQKK